MKSSVTLLATVCAVSCGCTVAHVSDGRASYWRASLGGDYISRGMSFEVTSNGIQRVTSQGFDDKRDESFKAACQSLEAIAATLGKLEVKP